MSGIPLVIQNVSGKYIKSLDIEIENVSCVIGLWEKDKEELVNILHNGKLIDKKYVRVIPKFRISIPLTVGEVLKLYEKNFGKRKPLLDIFLSLDRGAKVDELSEFEKFELELAQVFFGTTNLIIVESFTDTFEEQMKEKAIKLIAKTGRLLNAKILFLFSGMEFQSICERTYIIYGGRLLEYSTNNEFYHPYSQFLREAKLDIGKRGEKVEIPLVEEPAIRGCPFHDYCKIAKGNRKLFRVCVTNFPPKAIINKNEVYCWYYELGMKRL